MHIAGRRRPLTMSKYLDAAYAILQDAGGPLTADDMVKRALKAGLITTKGSTPAATMGSMLYTDIARGSSRFAKHDRGLFKLSGSAPPDKGGGGGGGAGEGGDNEEIIESHEKDHQRRIGAAGEYRVMSELLLRGYDVDHVTIDSGIDIRATKKGHVYQIQVKTATERKGDKRYITTIKKESFEKVGGPLLYYVFVLRDRRNGIRYAVISNKEMKAQIKNKNITENKAGYQVSFSISEGSLFLRKENVDRILNDWDLG